MKKSILIMFSLFVFGFTVSASTETKTFLDTIVSQKQEIESIFDSSYDLVYNEFQSSIGNQLSTKNYQSLECLGVVNDSVLLKQMQNDIKNIKMGFLNAYATIYTNALDVEQKNIIQKDTSVSLFPNGSDYETEKELILLSLEQLSENQKTLAENFQKSYISKIEKFLLDINDYSSNNQNLLSSVSNRIETIEEIQQKYNDLISDLLSYQSTLAGSGVGFFSKLNLLKQASVSGLDISLQNIINVQVRRYRILPTLSSELLEQKKYALGLFAMQFDEKVNLLLDKRYDNKEFTQIKKEVDDFVGEYRSEGNFNCTTLLSSPSFIDDSQNLITRIDSFSKTFSYQLSGSIISSGFKNDILQWFNLVIQLQKDMKKTFIDIVIQKKDIMLTEYKKQKELENGSSVVIEENVSQKENLGFSFTRAFKKGIYDSDIKVLQQLLKKLGYYNGDINSSYTQQTLEAVYQYQLSKNLLIGYEKKSQTWGWMGPATRAALNKDLLN